MGCCHSPYPGEGLLVLPLLLTLLLLLPGFAIASLAVLVSGRRGQEREDTALERHGKLKGGQK